MTNEELRQQLQEAFLEIAFRANRLREWVDLNRDLDSLRRSFEDFNHEATRFMAAIQNGGTQNANAMTGRWSRFSDTDLVDLRNARDNFQYIHLSARNEPVATPGVAPSDAALLTRVSLDALFELQDKIQRDLENMSYKRLSQLCIDFDKALKNEVSRYKKNMEKELKILCEMTLQVRMQI